MDTEASSIRQRLRDYEQNAAAAGPKASRIHVARALRQQAAEKLHAEWQRQRDASMCDASMSFSDCLKMEWPDLKPREV